MTWGLWTAYDLALVTAVLALASALDYIVIEELLMTGIIAVVGIAGVTAVKDYLMG